MDFNTENSQNHKILALLHEKLYIYFLQDDSSFFLSFRNKIRIKGGIVMERTTDWNRENNQKIIIL